MLTYPLNESQPMFLLTLVDRYGYPVTGVTTPTVKIVRLSGATPTVTALTEGVDFEWHELTDGSVFKGTYAVVLTTDPDPDPVDTVGIVRLCAYKTDFDTAYGQVTFRVVNESSLLDEVLPDGKPALGTVAEALKAARASVAGTREGRDGVERLHDTDRATVIFTRTANQRADNEPITKLTEAGDRLVRAGVGDIVIEGLPATNAIGVTATVGDIVIEGNTATAAIDDPITGSCTAPGDIEIEGNTASYNWSAP